MSSKEDEKRRTDELFDAFRAYTTNRSFTERIDEAFDHDFIPPVDMLRILERFIDTNIKIAAALSAISAQKDVAGKVGEVVSSLRPTMNELVEIQVEAMRRFEARTEAPSQEGETDGRD